MVNFFTPRSVWGGKPEPVGVQAVLDAQAGVGQIHVEEAPEGTHHLGRLEGLGSLPAHTETLMGLPVEEAAQAVVGLALASGVVDLRRIEGQGHHFPAGGLGEHVVHGPVPVGLVLAARLRMMHCWMFATDTAGICLERGWF
jgi:hypothetical protein